MNASEDDEQAEQAEDAELVAWVADELGVKMPDSTQAATPIAPGESRSADKSAEEPLGSSASTRPPVSEEAVRIADRILSTDAMPQASATTDAPETTTVRRTDESKSNALQPDSGARHSGQRIRPETSASRQRAGSVPSATSAGTSSAAVDAVLLVAGKQVAVPSDGCIIGREPGPAGIVVHHEEVSRQHAQIVVRAATMYVLDLGSTNGTVVQRGPRNRRITKTSFQLALGDQIRTGTGVLLAEIPDADRS